MFQNNQMNSQNHHYSNGFYSVNNGMPPPFNMNSNPYVNQWAHLTPQAYEQQIAIQEE
jgi:hypothetical protein